MTILRRMLQRRDTVANWVAANPTLGLGEVGVETDTNRFKIGDGATYWTALEYAVMDPENIQALIDAVDDHAVSSGYVDAAGHLILVRNDATEIDAGLVRGPAGATGSAPDLAAYQARAEKGALDGYATLDASGKVVYAQLPTGTGAFTITAGNDARVVGAQQVSEKGNPSGYASLDGTGKVPSAQLPVTAFTRATAAVTTGSLASGAQASTTIALAVGYRLYSIITNRPARVRLYTTTAKRTADVTRPIGTDPSGDHGLVLDFVFDALVLGADLSPMVDGVDLKGSPDGQIPVSIQNLDTVAGAVTVSFTYVRTE